MNCFWCDKKSTLLTRDHVVPVVAGGGDHDNIVMACHACQVERCKIQSLYGQIKIIQRNIDRWRYLTDHQKRSAAGVVKHAEKQLPLVLSLVTKWRIIETTLWGSSPSAALNLEIPDSPSPPKPPRKINIPRKTLEQARRAAEERFNQQGNS